MILNETLTALNSEMSGEGGDHSLGWAKITDQGAGYQIRAWGNRPPVTSHFEAILISQ